MNHPKFVQLVTGHWTSLTTQGSGYTLHALDETGEVWEYIRRDHRWVVVGSPREETVIASSRRRERAPF